MLFNKILFIIFSYIFVLISLIYIPVHSLAVILIARKKESNLHSSFSCHLFHTFLARPVDLENDFFLEKEHSLITSLRKRLPRLFFQERKDGCKDPNVVSKCIKSISSFRPQKKRRMVEPVEKVDRAFIDRNSEFRSPG